MININKKGIVSKVEGDKLQIMMTRSAACGDCSSCGGCEVETINLDLNNDIDAKIGDFVELKYNSSNMIKTTALLYIFPLIMLVIGIYFGFNLNLGVAPDLKELIAFGFGIIAMGISYTIVHLIDKKYKGNNLISIKKIDSIY